MPTNPFSTLVNGTLKDTHENIIDALLDNYSKSCILKYPDISVECINCYYDPISKKSTNRYKPGGPREFPNGKMCPYCKGVGLNYTKQTETVSLVLVWEPKGWVQLPHSSNQDFFKTPNTYLESWGYATLYPKLMKCVSATFSSDIIGYEKFIFERFGEAVFKGFRNKYFVQSWKRV